MDRKRELRPRKTLNGKDLRKSLDSFGEEGMVRNVMSAVTEKQSPTSEATANTWNSGLPSKLGLPLSSVPPGMELVVAKETLATTAATAEQD